jgi:hypothetical protein
MAAAQLSPEKKDGKSTSKITARVVPIIGTHANRGFICTALGVVVPGGAYISGNLPFCHPYAALLFWHNMDQMFNSELKSDRDLVSSLGFTSRMISMAISNLVNKPKRWGPGTDEATRSTRGKKSANTAAAHIIRTSAASEDLAYTAHKEAIVPITLTATPADLPGVMISASKIIQKGAQLAERYDWSYPFTTATDFQEKQRERRTPNQNYAVFECAEATAEPIKPVAKEPLPFEQAWEFLVKLVGGKKEAIAPVPTAKAAPPHAYTGTSQDGIKYMMTRKFNKSHFDKAVQEDDSDGECNLGEPVEDD